MLTHSNSLNWITRHFKGFLCPRIVIQEFSMNADAYYDWNWGSIVEIDGNEIVNNCGIIVLWAHSQYSEDTLILHEYRHHLQFSLNGPWDVPDWQNGESTKDYYRWNVFERDARLFQGALCHCDYFVDYFKTPTVSRSTMLQLPTSSFLSALPADGW